MSSVDKVTTGKQGFVSVFANVDAWFTIFLDDITQFPDHVRIRLLSQLNIGTCR